MRFTFLLTGALLSTVLLTGQGRSWAEEADLEKLNQKVSDLEETVQQLTRQVQLLQDRPAGPPSSAKETPTETSSVSVPTGNDETPALSTPSHEPKGLRLGGYGEIHANFRAGGSGEVVDFHRVVLYLDYDFADWIQLLSEIELEHAFVTDGSGGELSIEQLYVNLLLHESVNLRVGRVLTPVGIINKKHEPVTFNGVERPDFARFIIPTTWSSDGVGVFGSLGRHLRYEAYVVGSLDGSKFNAIDGIRPGRIKERPSLNDPAFTGRLDFYPFGGNNPAGQSLRFGVSTFVGGLNNGNKGKDPGIDGKVQVYSADFEYSIDRFDFRGVIAHESIDGAAEIGGGHGFGDSGMVSRSRLSRSAGNLEKRETQGIRRGPLRPL